MNHDMLLANNTNNQTVINVQWGGETARYPNSVPVLPLDRVVFIVRKDSLPESEYLDPDRISNDVVVSSFYKIHPTVNHQTSADVYDTISLPSIDQIRQIYIDLCISKSWDMQNDQLHYVMCFCNELVDAQSIDQTVWDGLRFNTSIPYIDYRDIWYNTDAIADTNNNEFHCSGFYLPFFKTFTNNNKTILVTGFAAPISTNTYGCVWYPNDFEQGLINTLKQGRHICFSTYSM